MTDTPQGNSEIADYRLAVERHLLDLPAPIREDLLNGLEEHLAEVAAEREPGVTLEDLLGGPEAYARELRETVETRREGLGERFRRSVVAPLANRSTRVAERFTTSAGVGDAAEFRKSLKPGWWVLRGVLAAGLFSVIAMSVDEGMRHFYGEFSIFTLIVVVALTAVFVWLSLRLGVRSERWGRNYQRLVAVAGAALFVAMAWVVYVDRYEGVYGPWAQAADEVYYTDGASYPPDVQDVYVYTEDGELLTDVYLFDQNGEPLMLGDPGMCGEGRPGDYPTEPMYDEYSTEPYEPGFSATAAPDPFAQTPDPYEYGYLYPLCDPSEASTGADETATPSEAPTTEEPTSEPTEDETPAPEPTG